MSAKKKAPPPRKAQGAKGKSTSKSHAVSDAELAGAKRAPAPPTGPDTLLTTLPGLDAPHRRVFTRQFTDAECAERGAKTRSLAVRDCAVSWASDATPALLNPALAPEIDYAPERMAWVIELCARLDAARSASGAKGKKQSTVRTERDVARSKAVALRKRLLGKVGRLVKGDDVISAALDEANAAPDDDQLVRSLEQLAALVDTSTKSPDADVRLLAAMWRVTPADADAARAAVAALKGASADVALGGRATGDRDTPEVNLVEGRLSFELQLLREAVEEARERGVPVPALVVPPGLRHVFPRTRPKKAAAADPKGDPKPGA
jgi:hypothetical protein